MLNLNPETGIKLCSSLGTFFFEEWNYLLDALVAGNDGNSELKLDDYELFVFHKGNQIFGEMLCPDEGCAGGYDSDYIAQNIIELTNLKLFSEKFLQQIPELNSQPHNFQDSQPTSEPDKSKVVRLHFGFPDIS
ncbi:hypothetical protein NG799_02145 [Laspinema sp. D1]|uniref:Uncharacterized protein n=1 Tax=Laspinema palackyanum D2a TaxID=2953684 RepID=A0ABT2MK54_9CYAN|nr:hypothetical protein [Laspinema sp. D2a]